MGTYHLSSVWWRRRPTSKPSTVRCITKYAAITHEPVQGSTTRTTCAPRACDGPLHLAVKYRHFSIVEYLVEDVNVDIQALGRWGRYKTNSFGR
eukprot:193907-Amorphochlora_amoeboformis.AAC.1